MFFPAGGSGSRPAFFVELRESPVLVHYVRGEPLNQEVVDLLHGLRLAALAGGLKPSFKILEAAGKVGMAITVRRKAVIADGGLGLLLGGEVPGHMLGQVVERFRDLPGPSPVHKDFGLPENFLVLRVQLGDAGDQVGTPILGRRAGIRLGGVNGNGRA